MEEKEPKYFTEEEIKELVESCKDCVRWTMSGEDFKETKNNAQKDNEPQR